LNNNNQKSSRVIKPHKYSLVQKRSRFIDNACIVLQAQNPVTFNIGLEACNELWKIPDVRQYGRIYESENQDFIYIANPTNLNRIFFSQ
jgi:hypothetical protein